MGEISLKILCKNGIEKLCLSLLLLWAIVLVIRSKSKIILDDYKYLFLSILFIVFFYVVTINNFFKKEEEKNKERKE